MSVAGADLRDFSAGRIFFRSVQSIQRNFQQFGLFSLLCIAAPGVVLGLLMLPIQQAAGDPRNVPWEAVAILNFISTVIGLIGYAGLISGYWADANGRAPSSRGMMKAGLARFLPMLLVGILMGVAILVGLLVLFIPGVIMGLMWCVVIPVQVIERPRGIAAFERSRALTRGKRWALFGMFLLYFLSFYMVLLTVGLVVGLATGGGVLAGMTIVNGPFAIVRILLMAVAGTVWGGFGAVFVASLYQELRMFKDGMAPQALSDVFA